MQQPANTVAPYLEIGQQAGAGAQRWVVSPPEADAAHESCHLTPAAEWQLQQQKQQAGAGAAGEGAENSSQLHDCNADM